MRGREQSVQRSQGTGVFGKAPQLVRGLKEEEL